MDINNSGSGNKEGMCMHGIPVCKGDAHKTPQECCTAECSLVVPETSDDCCSAHKMLDKGVENLFKRNRAALGLTQCCWIYLGINE